MGCENCIYESRFETIESDIKDLTKQQNDTKVDAKGMETTLEYIKKTVDEVKTKLDQVTSQPQKRWETIINTAIISVVTSLITAGMALILIK